MALAPTQAFRPLQQNTNVSHNTQQFGSMYILFYFPIVHKH